MWRVRVDLIAWIVQKPKCSGCVNGPKQDAELGAVGPRPLLVRRLIPRRLSGGPLETGFCRRTFARWAHEKPDAKFFGFLGDMRCRRPPTTFAAMLKV